MKKETRKLSQPDLNIFNPDGNQFEPIIGRNAEIRRGSMIIESRFSSQSPRESSRSPNIESPGSTLQLPNGSYKAHSNISPLNYKIDII